MSKEKVTIEINTKHLDMLEFEFGSIQELVNMSILAYHPDYIFSKFFDANFKIDPNAKTRDRLEFKSLYNEFTNFCIDLMNSGQKVNRPSKKKFSAILKARGAESRKSTGNMLYIYGVKRK